MLPGRQIENYELVRPIGSGGMADVYLVRHSLLGTSHALKLLHLGGASVAARLLAEGIVQANFRHVGLVRVTDAVVVDEQTAIVMDYVEGDTLAHHLQRQSFDLPTRLAIFDAVLDAVEHAHRQGVVHRDLKPANILIAMEDGRPVPRIVDFGLVKVVSDTISVPCRRQATGAPMGTPNYMSPEQICSDPRIDQRADLFALGCILHELVTERPPFERASAAETFAAITIGDYAPAGDYGCGRDVEGAVAACLAVRREDRPANVAALRWLLSARASRPTSPTLTPLGPTDAPVARTTPRRGDAFLAVSLLSMAVALGGVTLRTGPLEAEAIAAPVAVASLVETAEPAASLVPAAPRPASIAPPPASTAPQRAPSTGFDATGATVRLRDNRGDTWRPGDAMKPGNYRIRADFGDGFVNAGRARIVDGRELHLDCSPKSQTCDAGEGRPTNTGF